MDNWTKIGPNHTGYSVLTAIVGCSPVESTVGYNSDLYVNEKYNFNVTCHFKEPKASRHFICLTVAVVSLKTNWPMTDFVLWEPQCNKPWFCPEAETHLQHLLVYVTHLLSIKLMVMVGSASFSMELVVGLSCGRWIIVLVLMMLNEDKQKTPNHNILTNSISSLVFISKWLRLI